MPPRKKPSKRATAKQCDAVFGRIVRAPGICMNCGSTEVIQCAHGFSRSYRATRWDRRNGFNLCRKCHMHYTHRPLEWDAWLRRLWGDRLYDEMRALALTHLCPDLDELFAELKAIEAAVSPQRTTR